MRIVEAEWIISKYKEGEKSFQMKRCKKQKLLEESPYAEYNCEFCEIEWSARKILKNIIINCAINVGCE